MATIPEQKIRPSQALANLAKRFAPIEVQPDDDSKALPQTDIFTVLALDRNIELDQGDNRTYDVIPDFRGIMAACAKEISTIYADVNIKGHPIVTPLSYMAYCLSLTYALALIFDCHSRRIKSFSAQNWMDDRDKKDFYSRVQHLRIPTFLQSILKGLSPVYDPRRSGHEFVYTLAGFVHKLDFGRIIPVTSLWKAHDLLASTRSNIDPQQLLYTWYSANVYTINNVPVANGNLYGTALRNAADNAAFARNNFMTSFIETVFNGVTSRFHSTRPTFKRTPLDVPEFAVANDTYLNGYDYAFGIPSEGSPIPLLEYIETFSVFIENSDSRTIKLGQYLGELASISIMSHAVIPPMLPTFHMKPVSTEPKDISITDQTDEQFAQMISYLQASPNHAPDHTNNIDYVEKSDDNKTTHFLTNLYLALTKKIAISPSESSKAYQLARITAKCPDKFVTFSKKEHVTPRIRLFDPYDYNPSKFAFPILCGLWIESAEIDGFMIPTPHVKSTLHEENSFCLQAGIPASKVINWFQNTGIHIIDRAERSGISQPISFATQDMTVNRIPRFLGNVAGSIANALDRFNIVENVEHVNLASNRWSHDASNEPPIPDNSIYLWSPYRVLLRHRKPNARDIIIISSFRGVYGTNITFAESRHPFSLIPH